MTKPLNHFYRFDYETRLTMLEDVVNLTASDRKMLRDSRSDTGNDIVENYLTDFNLPEGLATNFKINGKLYQIPMVTEEPSVIAAASNGAQLVAKSGGFVAKVQNRQMIGQIVLENVSDENKILDWIHSNEALILKTANEAHPSVLKYGQGATQVRLRNLSEGFISIDLVVDVGEAMGANIIDGMTEAVSKMIQSNLSADVLMSILSNFATESLVTVKCQIALETLTTAALSGEVVATKIEQATKLATLDPYRAATHNKGIMNGIDAVIIAFGNDWRAIESGAYAYACRSGKYQPLSQWTKQDGYLVGEMTLPMPVAFTGGATKVLPLVAVNKRIADVKSARELMMVVGSVGLAQNLAALKALVTEGIQRGHMSLQIKSLARSAGATHAELAVVVDRLSKMSRPDLASAKTIISEIRRKKSSK
ncbi:hypothetical protein C5L31_000738 [Secundilactobacillus malefermentans]|uniref:3-hydroxy-3-methylglutaryl coenzyme A reductase n=1 Tax=Secundilactobacillus malefermentans TaxID=176292 RepID=A0A4R5NRA1_9LACO|nr:hydroxymethylglutaryl-CoA reductase, degradative [Secundilactobacillus malefermentans]KRM58982.1 hydroxymethylglutaryl-CoA reductase [Secundilactobacillus malefermentans DSM 5705 = KCTC 3548]TDG79471.1 hypothetical protein C5L31_000738 [Secundilactobacillus malefermentans]